jgi:N utilization substance protein B
MNRRQAREHAFLLIYQIPFYEDFNPVAVYRDFASGDLSRDGLPEYIFSALKGVCEHIGMIDEVIARNLHGWEMDRLNKTDLAALRLCVYELLFEPEIPEAVSINEAVELAKKYGTDDSKSFVNGVLSGVSKQLGAC